jgi:hypothetical protein
MTISESIQNTGNIEFWRNVSNRKNTIAWMSRRSKSNNDKEVEIFQT